MNYTMLLLYITFIFVQFNRGHLPLQLGRQQGIPMFRGRLPIKKETEGFLGLGKIKLRL